MTTGWKVAIGIIIAIIVIFFVIPGVLILIFGTIALGEYNDYVDEHGTAPPNYTTSSTGQTSGLSSKSGSYTSAPY